MCINLYQKAPGYGEFCSPLHETLPPLPPLAPFVYPSLFREEATLPASPLLSQNAVLGARDTVTSQTIPCLHEAYIVMQGNMQYTDKQTNLIISSMKWHEAVKVGNIAKNDYRIKTVECQSGKGAGNVLGFLGNLENQGNQL